MKEGLSVYGLRLSLLFGAKLGFEGNSSFHGSNPLGDD